MKCVTKQTCDKIFIFIVRRIFMKRKFKFYFMVFLVNNAETDTSLNSLKR